MQQNQVVLEKIAHTYRLGLEIKQNQLHNKIDQKTKQIC